MLTADRVFVVDWAYTVTGPPWLDLLFFLPSVAAHGGVDPAVIWRDYPPARNADPDGVTAVLTALAGDFLYGPVLRYVTPAAK